VGKDGPAGLGSTPDQHYAIELARRGYVTIAPDALAFGERQDPRGKLKDASYERFEALHRITEGKSLQGKYVWDARRALDYLETRPEVDRARIGMIGHSLGGPGDAVHDRRRHAHPRRGLELRVRQPARPRARPHPPQLRAVRARPGRGRRLRRRARPRRPAPVPGRRPQRGPDLPDGRHRGDGRGGRAAFTAAGAADRLGTFYEPGPHQFSPAMREAAYAWLDRWLKPATK
jgi:hypothetical protein